MSETSGTYKRSESYLDWDLDNDLVEREEQAKFIRNRRRLVLASVVTIFLLTSIVMVMSVVYVEMNKGVLGFKVNELIRVSSVQHFPLCAGADVCRE